MHLKFQLSLKEMTNLDEIRDSILAQYEELDEIEVGKVFQHLRNLKKTLCGQIF